MSIAGSAERVLASQPCILVKDFTRDIVADHKRMGCEFAPDAENIAVQSMPQGISDRKVSELPISVTELLLSNLEKLEIFCPEEGIDLRDQFATAEEAAGGRISSPHWFENY